MIKTNEMYYGLDDIQIMPYEMTTICSRDECNPFNYKSNLPLFTAPMSTVVDEKNYNLFKEEGITPIIPRNINIEKRLELLKKGEWTAFSLSECEEIFTNNNYTSLPNFNYNILIDVANGHMKKIYELAMNIKRIYPYTKIMVGNIANHDTYRFITEFYSKAIDYVRIGIGSGSGCTTSTHTSIHTPIVSLISKCCEIRNNWLKSHENEKCPKIIADGGMRNYSDIIKMLAIGADYIMCGNLFAKMLETPGEVYKLGKIPEIWGRKIDQYSFDINSLRTGWEYLSKDFYGMASENGQKDLGKDKINTPEGMIKKIEVEYTIKEWTDNFKSYLKSAMSYSDSRNLNEFKEKSNVILVSNTISNNGFNKL